jgi:2-phosphoglycerate kinase
MRCEPRVILIGGSSHLGKSTLARRLAERMAWHSCSTDKLARHPGRPWGSGSLPVPPHVSEHYLSLSDHELIASVLDHYRNMQAIIADLITRYVEDRSIPTLVLEGSAVLPEMSVALVSSDVFAVWLITSDALIDARIRRESQFESRDGIGRELIGKFIERSRRHNRHIKEAVARLGLPHIDVKSDDGIDDLVAVLLGKLP